MNNEITSVEFWNEIEAMADNVIDGDYNSEAIDSIREKIEELSKRVLPSDIEELKNEIESDIEELTLEMINDDMCDLVHEQTDGHEWVIYTGRAWQVSALMRGDDNACREFEELCSIENGKSLDDLITQFAYCAISSNVSAELESALERLKEKLLKEMESAKL